ncbi:uracil nucleotide/cysteinyl leukotriene receptor-like [Alosa sapidissima]|uniref:uracil nucleotide/cysteinyl leukotriene receptor-like n=1 Tax=Alosa sapidissima TaxID=34773 RepID=UPI001C094800|nr:uracil nucleotide/cysteinyl leukotriene receptor-like [Alosa sapidissima]
MEEAYNQTSVYITPTHTYLPTSGFENSVTYFKDNNSQSTHLEDNLDLAIHSLSFLAAFLGLCFAVYGLYSLVKTGLFSQVFVINLFISDLIQTFANLIGISKEFVISSDLITITIHDFWDYMRLIFFIGVMANVCFMVLISAERYGMIAHPVWYRSLHTIRTSVIVSVTVWVILPIIVIITGLYTPHVVLSELLVMLLPYPWMIFFFVGTWRALSRNTSVPRHEQRRIMRTLALVLSIYTVLFLPYVMVEIDIYYPFVNNRTSWIYLVEFAYFLIALNPLFDFILYLFMRRDAKDIFRSLFCFCKRHEDERVTETVTEAQV